MAEVNKTNLRLITRLIESGITSEKQIMALKLKDILSIPNITKPELTALCELQEEIKSVGVLAFLAKPETKESREESESKESVNDET
jgi:hypothetical protein